MIAWPLFARRLAIRTAASRIDTRFIFSGIDPASPTSDYLNIPRNQTLYQYLQQITGGAGGSQARNIPGFGGNFQGKWGL